MKFLMMLILIFYLAGFAGEEQTVPPAANPQNTPSESIQADSSHAKLSVNDVKKFYIGFAESETGMRLITLNLEPLDSTNDVIRFAYKMNSVEDRKDGEGKILLDKNVIEFNSMDAGKIQRDADGKLVLESIKQDSLSYWKMKEK